MLSLGLSQAEQKSIGPTLTTNRVKKYILNLSSIIQIVLVSNDGEWEWFWAKNQSYYPSGRNPEICILLITHGGGGGGHQDPQLYFAFFWLFLCPLVSMLNNI